MYCMIDDNGKFKIVNINNISGTTLTDINNNKYNKEKVKYVWNNRVPIENPGYMKKHLLEEKNDGN